ncbi:hypothetical protein BH20ACT23_BH20ACT23_17190 [soil metagenome]
MTGTKTKPHVRNLQMAPDEVRRSLVRLVIAGLLVAGAISSCSGSDDGASDGAETPGGAPRVVTGPLCDMLPVGTDPGGPATLTSESADAALQWIPVLTIFEAGARASRLAADLRDADGITILAPTDDAFTTTFSQKTLDQLLISRRKELRALLRAHMIDEALSLAELLEARSVTTLAGDRLAIAPMGNMARLDDRAQTVCADYRVANARIHVIDGVLGDLPEPVREGNSRSD